MPIDVFIDIKYDRLTRTSLTKQYKLRYTEGLAYKHYWYTVGYEISYKLYSCKEIRITDIKYKIYLLLPPFHALRP